VELSIAMHLPHQDIHNINLKVTILPNELELDLDLKQFLPFYQYKTDSLPLYHLKILLVSGLDPLYLAPLEYFFLG
jgi:hypothetical protein